MTTAMSGLNELLQIGREYALLGNYNASLTYYDGFNAQLASYLVSPESVVRTTLFRVCPAPLAAFEPLLHFLNFSPLAAHLQGPRGLPVLAKGADGH